MLTAYAIKGRRCATVHKRPSGTGEGVPRLAGARLPRELRETGNLGGYAAVVDFLPKRGCPPMNASKCVLERCSVSRAEAICDVQEILIHTPSIVWLFSLILGYGLRCMIP